ncbi:hypothetical protein AB1Y20_021757 [Prymnesium parvum]|uniref:Cyclin-dependent kinases regulatory subunit n=1 Tax=Prymnesium parvum TaxID=97485 RepID=A0AB34JMD8_PRYPA
MAESGGCAQTGDGVGCPIDASRVLTVRARLPRLYIMSQEIEYSEKYHDDDFEYRHVILPKHVAKNLPKPSKLLGESEWRGLGVQQSRGWVHYAIHKPEPHILLFRRPLGTDPTTGLVHGKRIDPGTGKVIG